MQLGGSLRLRMEVTANSYSYLNSCRWPRDEIERYNTVHTDALATFAQACDMNVSSIWNRGGGGG